MMSDIREKAERLVTLDKKERAKQVLTDAEWKELTGLTDNFSKSVAFASAYLTECEAHERTNERLNDALKSCKERVDACSVCVGKGSVELPFDPFAEDCWQCAPYRDFLASIEQKEGVSK